MKAPMADQREISIPVEKGAIAGTLAVPPNALSIVIFAHGSGSSRLSPRNQFVAEALQQAGMATLLMDLLTPAEDSVDEFTAEHRFNIGLLASRVVLATDWVLDQPDWAEFNVGYFGASTGAAAALVAAAERPTVQAVVSRGGRPDLAGEALHAVKAPTLLIVGGDDVEVIELNRQALAQLQCEKRIAIIPGASHLFEEPGTLEQVANLARNWFVEHFGSASRRAA
jgi:putative phosphoribosyl transferase